MTFFEFNKRFPSEKSVIDYFIKIRYRNALTCPKCGAKTKVYRWKGRAKVVHCKRCNNQFSVFAGTIFEGSSTDMRKWFYAIHLFLNAKKGVSACQLQRELGVTYKTAWRILMRIRTAMGNERNKKLFKGIVEIDETYVGGKPRKINVKLDKDGKPIFPGKKKLYKRGRGTKKTPVVGIKERGSGRVHARVMLPNEEGRKLTGKQLLAVLDEACKKGTTVISDDLSSYKILDKKTAKNFAHLTVNHSKGQYSAGGGVDTNGIENFWSILKRMHYGTYHSMSEKHLQSYVNECAFRANHRGDAREFEKLLKQTLIA
jgi:transposase-like protein